MPTNKTNMVTIIKKHQINTTLIPMVCTPMSEFCLKQCGYKSKNTDYCNAHRSNIGRLYNAYKRTSK